MATQYKVGPVGDGAISGTTGTDDITGSGSDFSEQKYHAGRDGVDIKLAGICFANLPVTLVLGTEGKPLGEVDRHADTQERAETMLGYTGAVGGWD